eukprot:CAMPEP_0183706920 /NCGR_PEP_ID=MMETSP0737-20130205/3638_1 /TAXON_ID=385413 /ORGANISM="Thalassiosira miniscula, Strain CCMP1093" /LENGTH=165 /DNA_ID=CAMNT_0025934459 /DNA_START=50 /DNA_END=547 /DNA_ORIENTATION=-
MNLKNILVAVLAIPFVRGDNLRGSIEHEDAIDQDHRFLPRYPENPNRPWSAAQKRMYQRDKRRNKTNPFRTKAEADRERLRKHRQANRRGNPGGDPYEPGYGDKWYAGGRSGRRRQRCADSGRDCNWRGLDYDVSPHGGYDRDYRHGGKHYPIFGYPSDWGDWDD